MTIDEASERYQIPIEVLKEYESWGLCGSVKKVMGMWQYDDQDLERLGMIMTLHQTGFDQKQIREYMELYLAGEETAAERMRILKEKRDAALDEIHFQEKKLESLDYLRYQIRKNMEEKERIFTEAAAKERQENVKLKKRH